MQKHETSIFSHGLIWFGAAVSIAEILTGTLLAPLGFKKGVLAIVIGHAIGCLLLFLAGLIGAKTGKSAMETTKISFGQKGALLFTLLNIIQLIGWTSVMIASGASAAGSITRPNLQWLWSVLIGVLIILWVIVGIKNVSKLNVAAMSLLFILTILLSLVVFRTGHTPVSQTAMTFGAAIELSVAMPLSWLPLISDYTRNAAKPVPITAASAGVYFLASCWMYIVGLGAALFTGETDIGIIMSKAGLGIAALIIIIFSTVTTTFLDAYSAGVSSESLSSRLKEKPAAIVVCIIGILLAVFSPGSQFENFLYFISSVFAPMIAILTTDYFILKKDYSGQNFSRRNLLLWLTGFIIYRVFIYFDVPIGTSVPVMIITILLCILTDKISGGNKHVPKNAK